MIVIRTNEDGESTIEDVDRELLLHRGPVLGYPGAQMIVVHFSDWHWQFQHLPPADLYVCTGDMLDDYPSREKKGLDRHDRYGGWRIEREYSRRQQEKAMANTAGQFRAKFLGAPAAPVVCLRGNHDWTDIAPLFDGDVRELVMNEVAEIAGLRVTGHRGIPPINGAWNDEVNTGELIDRVIDMPLADLYLTHYGPAGIGLSEPYGLRGVVENLVGRPGHALHCFGHIHERAGVRRVGGVMFSNAATTYNRFEGSPATGWTDTSPPA